VDTSILLSRHTPDVHHVIILDLNIFSSSSTDHPYPRLFYEAAQKLSWQFLILTEVYRESFAEGSLSRLGPSLVTFSRDAHAGRLPGTPLAPPVALRVTSPPPPPPSSLHKDPALLTGDPAIRLDISRIMRAMGRPPRTALVITADRAMATGCMMRGFSVAFMATKNQKSRVAVLPLPQDEAEAFHILRCLAR
jgi:hypothetical protein